MNHFHDAKYPSRVVEQKLRPFDFPKPIYDSGTKKGTNVSATSLCDACCERKPHKGIINRKTA